MGGADWHGPLPAQTCNQDGQNHRYTMITLECKVCAVPVTLVRREERLRRA